MFGDPVHLDAKEIFAPFNLLFSLPCSFLAVSSQDDMEMDTFQIECLKDGTWSNKIPVCKSKKTKWLIAKDIVLPLHTHKTPDTH